jgi:hypothetical protein
MGKWTASLPATFGRSKNSGWISEVLYRGLNDDCHSGNHNKIVRFSEGDVNESASKLTHSQRITYVILHCGHFLWRPFQNMNTSTAAIAGREKITA